MLRFVPILRLRSASRALALLAICAGVSAPVLAQPASPPRAGSLPKRELTATRATGPITLDGVLDEIAWSPAPVASGFIQNEPREGQAATFDTDVRVLYDDDALYVGVFAHDTSPADLVVSDLKKDFNTAAGDAFLVVVDTFSDQRNGFEFATNPAGAKWDAQMANEGRESNANWDGIWDVRTRVREDGWVAEFRIPLKTLKFARQTPQSWGLNFQRRLRRLNEDSYWAPLPRIYNLERVSLAGTLSDLRELQPGRNLRVKPYVSASSSTVGVRAADGSFDGGVDVKYGLTSGLTLDATLNTDFSQVEADEQQVNLTRFSVLFPEKRDFFLENSGIFQFGLPYQGSNTLGSASPAASGRQNSPPDMKLFFSRTIGLSDTGDAIPILAGSRVTGRAGAYALGALNIQQRAQGTVPATNFTALRADRSVLANSDIGVMLLNKDAAGSGYNRIGGVDANFRFGGLSLGAYAVKTASSSDKAGVGDAFSTRANFNYTSRKYLLRGAYEVIGRGFRDELGFVPRVGVNHAASYGRINVRPQWASRVLHMREIGPHFHFDEFDRRDGSGTESRYFDWHVVLTMNDSGFFESGVNTNREGTVTPFTLNSARGVKVLPGVYDFNEYFALYRSNNAKRVSYETRVSFGGLYDGTRNGYAFAPTIRLNEHLNASVGLQINDINLPQVSYVSKLVATRVNYAFNTQVFLNTLVQYNTDNRQWSSNVRFNVIHRPLSDIFVVYNERRLDTTGDLIDRALIAKMTWMVAF